MKKLITILLILIMAGAASAGVSKVGTSGAQFLKIGVGSRYQGMGDASVAMVNDVYAAYWNPAGLADVENWSVGFTNVNWLLDVDLNHFGLAKTYEDVGTFALSATVLSMGDQEITVSAPAGEERTGEFYTATSYQVGFSYARNLTAKFAFGATFKYVGERIHKVNSTGFGFDLGTRMHTGFKSLTIAMSITNLGPSMKFTGTDLDVGYDPEGSNQDNDSYPATLKTTDYELPMAFRFGASYEIYNQQNSSLTLSGEVKHPNDMTQQSALGAEYSYSKKFFLRSGYKFGYDEERLSLGAGLRTEITRGTTLIIDYAWQDFGRFNDSQKFSVGFTF